MLFRWLTNLLTPTKPLEIQQVKNEVKAQIKRVCARAKKGDTDASLLLKKVEETIAEQSIRLTGRPKPPSTVILPPDSAQPQ